MRNGWQVYVVGTNGRKVTLIAGLEHLSATLETLVLRSHVIARMENLATLVHLTKLELCVCGRLLCCCARPFVLIWCVRA